MFAQKWLLACVNSLVFLQMMLEFESLSTPIKVALELSQFRTIGMICQVTLQLGQIWKLFCADSARQIRILRMSGQHVPFQNVNVREHGAAVALNLSLRCCHPGHLCRTGQWPSATQS